MMSTVVTVWVDVNSTSEALAGLEDWAGTLTMGVAEEAFFVQDFFLVEEDATGADDGCWVATAVDDDGTIEGTEEDGASVAEVTTDDTIADEEGTGASVETA